MTMAIDVQGLRKSFGGRDVLCGLSLRLPEGQIHTVLGPNGAGKTTLNHLLLGLARPDSGEVRVMGGSPLAPATRMNLGATPQDSVFPQGPSVREILNFVRQHYANPADLNSLLEEWNLTALAGRRAQALSGGQKRSLSLACAFAGRPKLVLLDEPTAGLDLEMRAQAWRRIGEFRDRGGTVLLTTHHLEEAEALSDHLILLYQGRMHREGTLEDLQHAYQLRRIHFRTFSSWAPEDVLRAEQAGEEWTLWVRDSDAWLKAHRLPDDFRGLEISAPSLDEIFKSAFVEDKT